MQWAIDVDCDEARDDMIFDCLDHRLCCIYTVVVGLNYLNLGAVASDVGLDCLEEFVVNNIELWLEVFSF